MKKLFPERFIKFNLYQYLCLVFICMLILTGCKLGLSGISQGDPQDIPDEMLTPDDSGSNVWIEFPREGMILDNKPYVFVIYSADAIGISSISLFLNEEPFPPIRPLDLSSDGSGRQMRADQPWTPPYEGSYTLMASATSKSGDSSPIAMVRFCVVACDDQPPTVIDVTDTPTATVTIPSTTVTITPSVTSTYSTVALFSAYPARINAGACSELSWTVTGALSVTLGNTPVNPSGTLQVCICETTSYTLSIEWPDGQTEQLNTTIDVTGTCTPPTLTPTTEPQDTIGPSFDTGYLIWEDCKFYGMTDLTDPSGISWAKFGYNLNNEGWLWAWMFDTGSGWQSEFGVSVLEGIGTPIGNIQYQFRSSDNFNNESYSEIFNYSYSSCDG